MTQRDKGQLSMLADEIELAMELRRGNFVELAPRCVEDIIAALRQSSDKVLPCEFIVGAGHFHAGVKVETVQDAVNRLYEHMRGLECELGYLCWKCKSAIYPGQPRHAFNVAPNAASGGTFVYVHETCPADTLKAFQERIGLSAAK